MNLIYFLFHLFLCLYNYKTSLGTSISYINIERPLIDFYDPKVVKNITVFSRRIDRQDPRHYLQLHLHTLIEVNKSVEIVLNFYQFLTNRYRPSFIEMRYIICDMVESDNFIGIMVKNALNNITCPVPPGKYDLLNMKFPFVPVGFPFTKGRIFVNVTQRVGNMVKLIVSAHGDMEIKTMKNIL